MVNTDLDHPNSVLTSEVELNSVSLGSSPSSELGSGSNSDSGSSSNSDSGCLVGLAEPTESNSTFEDSINSESDSDNKPVVRHKIVKVVLDNFQSWVESSGPLEFKEDVLNMIKARNETGKSVMFKVFKQMCYPGKGGNLARLDLLRRFCKTATATIYMSDGYIIRFVIDRADLTKQTTTQWYELIDPDGHVKRFFGSYLPEPIREVLGWYVDHKQEILLNLIEKDGPQLFINTSGSFNANALKFITENPVVTEALHTMGEWDGVCGSALESLTKLYNNLQGRIASLKYTDVTALMLQNAAIEEILPAWIGVDSACMRLTVCDNVLRMKPVEPDCDFKTADKMYELCHDCADIFDAAESAERVLKLKPQDVIVDWDTADQMKDISSNLSALESVADVFDQVCESRPQVISDIDFERCEQIAGVYAELNDLIHALAPVVHLSGNRPEIDVSEQGFRQATQIADLVDSLNDSIKCFGVFNRVLRDRPRDPGSIDKATSILNVVRSIEESYLNLKKLAVTLNERQQAFKCVRVTEVELNKLFQQLDVCPVCGSQIKPGTHAHLSA